MPTQRIPTVRFAELPVQYHVQPTFSGPSIYEQQEQGPYPTWEAPVMGDLEQYVRALEEEYMDVSEDPRPGNEVVVAPGFWRPNKLY